MKYITLPAIICCGLLASCGTDNTAAEAQSQVDSIVTSKTAIIEAQLKRNNDSIINAMAVAKADSLMGKAANKTKDTATAQAK